MKPSGALHHRLSQPTENIMSVQEAAEAYVGAALSDYLVSTLVTAGMLKADDVCFVLRDLAEQHREAGERANLEAARRSEDIAKRCAVLGGID